MMSMAQEIKKIHVNFQGPSCDKSQKYPQKRRKNYIWNIKCTINTDILFHHGNPQK